MNKAVVVSGFDKCTGAKYYYWSDFFHWSITITCTTILYPSYKIWGGIWSSFYCENQGLFLILLYISWLGRKSLFVHHSPLYLLISGYQGVEFEVRINSFISESSGQPKIEHICTVIVVSGSRASVNPKSQAMYNSVYSFEDLKHVSSIITNAVFLDSFCLLS